MRVSKVVMADMQMTTMRMGRLRATFAMVQIAFEATQTVRGKVPV